MSHLKKWIAKNDAPRQNQIDWMGKRKVGLSSATSPVRKGCERWRTTDCRSDENGECGTFTLTQYLMMESHVNHLGRKTSETFWILQDEVVIGMEREREREARAFQFQYEPSKEINAIVATASPPDVRGWLCPTV